MNLIYAAGARRAARGGDSAVLRSKRCLRVPAAANELGRNHAIDRTSAGAYPLQFLAKAVAFADFRCRTAPISKKRYYKNMKMIC
jgi:hypothetical protein